MFLIFYLNISTFAEAPTPIQESLSLLETKVPQEYEFIMSNLTGGVQYSNFYIPNVNAMVWPEDQWPTAFIINKNLTGINLAGVIAHEAYHVHEHKNNRCTGEMGAQIYEAYIVKLLKSK